MSKYWMNDVIICHGSNYSCKDQAHFKLIRTKKGLTKIKLAKRYKPSVAASEITMFLKIGSWKKVPKVMPPSVSLAIASIPLAAKKNAAN